jgi:hypothetical protein
MKIPRRNSDFILGRKAHVFVRSGQSLPRVLCITVATWGLPSNRQIDLVLSCANVSSCFAASTLKMERVRGGVLWTGQRPPQPVWSSKISPKGGRVSCTDPTATSRCLRNPCPGIRRSLAKVMEKILLSHRSHKFLPVCAAFATISNVLPTCPPTSLAVLREQRRQPHHNRGI